LGAQTAKRLHSRPPIIVVGAQIAGNGYQKRFRQMIASALSRLLLPLSLSSGVQPEAIQLAAASSFKLAQVCSANPASSLSSFPTRFPARSLSS